MFDELLQQFDFMHILIRLIMSMILGASIGFDRSKKGSPAGLKTHSLVCIGSTLVMLTSEYCFVNYELGDITRLPAQVISGIGFLGAGMILVTGNDRIKGLTSAASIWFSACIGLAVGIGFYSGAIAATVLEIIVLKLLSKHISPQAKYTTIDMYLEYTSEFDLSSMILLMKDNHIELVNEDNNLLKNLQVKENTYSTLISVQILGKTDTEEIVELLESVHGVSKVYNIN